MLFEFVGDIDEILWRMLRPVVHAELLVDEAMKLVQVEFDCIYPRLVQTIHFL